ncbi:MAG: amino acid adenylation domain-containing protein [Okeania sp. SIO2G4]|uniref:non-ribosomal peptide synthetase n=1 Tax=unclassified Okeania TaxID=2634635 RepID=UPI0013B7069C|nr:MULTISPECIES: non-ribosomal peptide synthetase [unclassified Okeania]NEP72550.1 amino acid adenylation domain-containing protein [Okeania sp. SIO2G5]NEP94142.1 amino acid adenylation domain-containing protein [Okeania sp. SIO2F5]NEQ91259.1 amino acid adenylation domain-containing protein [Okeania sp. SIO2G4]
MTATTTIAGFRLSPQQKYLWRLQENNLNYLAKCTIKIQGKVKVSILKSALEKILNRHDNFRTTFQSRPGIKMPIQVILEDSNISWTHLNLSNLKSEKQTEQIGEILQNQNGLMAQLDQQPIFPTVFLTLSEEEHLLLVSLPALIADSFTLNNLVKEISESYDLCLQESDFDEEAVQYLQFSEWQNELLEEEDAEAEIAYWQNKQFQWVNLPFEKSQFEAEKFTPEQYSLNLDANVIAKLEVNILPNITIENFLLACWQTLLWRLTKQSDITIKTVFSGRQYEDLEEVMGLLAKSLPISCQLEENLKFTQLLEQISDRLTEASERQEYFINSETEVPGIGFEFIDISKTYLGGDLSFSLENQSVIFEDFKIKLNCIKTQESLIAEFQYNSELINIDVIKSFAKQFEALVASVVENIDATISQLNIFNKSEIKILLDELNQTGQNYPQEKLIHQIFESQVELYPNNIAVVFEDEKLTYAELNSQANQLAHYLQKKGVEAETIVGIFMERSLEVIIAILAILKAGAAYLPLDTKLPEENLAFRLEDAGVNILLSQSEIAPKNLNQNIKIITKTDENIAQQPQTNPTSKVNTENLAYILYTSGSTGKPKGVAIEHRQILNYLQGIQEKLQISSVATSAIVSTFAADLGNTVIFPTLCSGGCLHIISQECASDATALANYFQRHPIDYLKIVPSHLSTLLTSNPSPFLLPRQCLILGGEAATWDLIANIQQHLPQCRILNHYGPTETTVGALTYPVDNSNNYNAKTVPIGRPLANTQVYVLDEKLQPVPVGVPGELHIGGAGLARGYFNRPELTAEKFIPLPSPLERGRLENVSPLSTEIQENVPPLQRGVRGDSSLYKTGDLVRYLPDGNIEFIGRIDNQVKIRGFRIELGEIEAAIASHPEVQTAVVIVKGDDSSNKRLVAYFVPTKKQSSPNNLRQFLQEKLPDYAIPSAFVKLEFLPLTPNGKIDRKALPEPDSIRQELENFVAPRNPTEELLANIWSQLLKVEKIGIHDNFFSVGGNSLLATQVISRLRIAFKTEIPLKYLFDFPTVGELSKAIDDFKGEKLQLPPIEPISRDIDIPLSFAQQRLWFLDRFEEETTAYHNYGVLELKGKLNISALETAIEEIVRRHEVLRTNFVMKNGNPIQVINAPSSFSFPIIDLQSLPEAEKLTAAQKIVKEEQARLFDLSNDSLLRVSLLKLEAESHILSLVMHHIVTDGWSTGILIRELSSLYQAFSEGKPSTLPELSIQYADFAYWQRQWLSQELREANLNYWKQQLAGAPPLLELPTDRPRPAIQTFRGSIESFRVNSTITQKLKTLSQQSGATLFMALLSAFVVLLSRYSNQDDIVVGSPIANRDRSEIEPLMGFFVNTLVLRTQLQGNSSFSDILEQVRQVTLESYARQDVPFEQLVEALQPERSLSYSPLFQVMFILQNAPMDKLELPDLTLTPLGAENVTAKFDLTLAMRETDTEIEGILEYNTDIFDAATIIRMGEHFQHLLEAIIANPEQPVTQLSLLTEAERHQLLVEWNDTAVEYPSDKCIHQLFEEQVEKNPDAVALVFEQEQLTYQQLNAKANQLAHYLQSLGVKTETLVGICIERSLEMVIGLLGILKAGGAYVPIDPSYPAERLSYMLEDAAVPVLLTSKSVMELLPEHSAQVVCLDGNWDTIANQSSENIASGVNPENLAYTIYTSGSTGKPKGAMNTHKGIYNRLLWMQDTYQLISSDRVIQKTPFSFDVSVWEFFWPLLAGTTLVVAAPGIHKDSEALINLIVQQQITTIHFVPSMLSVFLQAEKIKDCSSLKRVICSGEALSYQLQQDFQEKLKCELHNLYGPTEAAIDVTFWNCAVQKYPGIVPIGRPIANTQLYILDKNNQPVPIGVAGELHIGGAGLARGYLNRPELTAEKFIIWKESGGRDVACNVLTESGGKRLYKTGDLARYLPDGNIEYLGRIDNQVKLRGFRIELGEIESVLSSYPQVQQTVVIIREDNPGNKRLVAYIVSSDSSLSSAELQSYLLSKLPEYMVPSAFVFLETIPLTPNGKINRKALPAPDIELTRTSEYVLPQTPIEKALASIWQELLKIEKISIHDNFFAVGGDSILSLQVVNRAQQAKIKITPKQIFQYPTIAQLAQVAESVTATLAQQGIVSGILPLTPIQQWFFEQNKSQPHHFNQSILLQVPDTVKPELLSQSVSKLLEHHDALRLRFIRTETGWQQTNQELDETVPFEVVNLSDIPESQQSANLSEIANNRQGSLNLSEGPLMRVVLFELGNNGRRLLIIIHHLAIDGVSWRVLLQDLLIVYQQLEQKQTVKLPLKTTAFQDFAIRLQEYAKSEKLQQQLNYWRSLPWSEFTPIPVDNDVNLEQNTVASKAEISDSLSVEKTRALLQEVPEAYNTQINDVLLTATLQTLSQWIGKSTVLIDLEGHGREDLFEDIDLSRTVGWFTSLFPVLLAGNDSKKLGESIKSVKEQLRAIPERGIGYGILRYLSRDSELNTLPKAQICFNYLGQLDNTQSSEIDWQVASESIGTEHSPEGTRSYLLDINAAVVAGKLQVTWKYSRNFHNESTIEKLSRNYIEALEQLIEHCLSPEAGGYTPSDFPLAQLNQLQLDQILAAEKLNKIESIYPLSPMQQGILFHVLVAPNSGTYFNQLVLTLSGEFQVEAFQQAWQKVIDRQSILRTMFVWEKCQQPLQIVHQQVDLPWNYLDWQTLSSAEQQNNLDTLLTTQRQDGFALNQAPLMHCTLIRVSEQTYKFIWSHHHILIDGWGSSIIFKEVLNFYQTQYLGQGSSLPTPVPYKNYIAWLQQQDSVAAETFWRRTLSGFKTPTPLLEDKSKSDNSKIAQIDHIEKLHLSSATTKALESQVREHQLTLSTLIQGMWAVLLSCYSGESDVLFGVTVSGRPPSLPGVENIVGLFINTLPLRVNVSANESIWSWLKALQEHQAELQEYSYSPLAEIQSMSELPGGTPLFESIVVFENYPMDDSLKQNSESMSVTKSQYILKTSTPLTMVVAPGEELLVRIDYDDSRFTAQTIVQILENLKTLLEAIVANTQATDMELTELLDIVDKDRKRQQLLKEQELEANSRQMLKKIKRKPKSTR